MGFGTVDESGYPGYNGIWKKSTFTGTLEKVTVTME
jgi:hypothetical protein